MIELIGHERQFGHLHCMNAAPLHVHMEPDTMNHINLILRLIPSIVVYSSFDAFSLLSYIL
jgi:hypothetical protein